MSIATPAPRVHIPTNQVCLFLCAKTYIGHSPLDPPEPSSCRPSPANANHLKWPPMHVDRYHAHNQRSGTIHEVALALAPLELVLQPSHTKGLRARRRKAECAVEQLSSAGLGAAARGA